MRTLLLIVFGLGPVRPAVSAPPPTFEVASIKLNQTASNNASVGLRPGGLFVAENIPLRGLLEEAFRLKHPQLLGAPDWLTSERYDIRAKMDETAAAAMQKMSIDQMKEQFAQTLQTLFMDRLKLAVHHETKELPVYVLVAARSGPKLKESGVPSESGPAPKGPMIRFDHGMLTATAAPLSMFIETLSNQTGRVVLDKTGLRGNYDFELHWTPDESQDQVFKGATPAPAADATGPTLFTALQEQLGLKLESQKSPLDVVVIDHIEKPSEN
jgi:uncharacterized protein (TIGR03435 family)